MPTYAYACTQCGHTFDLVQSFSEDPLTICPECEGRLRKVYGSIGITFKGSGFYRTDSRAGASIPGSSGGGSDSGKAKGSGGGSSDGSGSASSSGAAAASPA
ncbi:MAG: FmdB family zinc ribbon protein [Dermatophilaceae bacterium]